MSKHAEPIRVLVVDDSAFMRNALSMMLMKCADIQVVGTAVNGQDAIAQAQRIQPHVMTLDIDMPGMNGLAVLDHMMVNHPLPIIMVSALTQEGAQVTLEALGRGAIDFIAKPVNHDLSEIGVMEAVLHAKVREAFQVRDRLPAIRLTDVPMERPLRETAQDLSVLAESLPPVKRSGKTSSHHCCETSQPCDFPLVVIGASTGGPNLLKTVIRELPSTFPAALLIVQHMPKYFTNVFAESLNAIGTLAIREAQDGDEFQVGKGFVVPGDHHMRVTRKSTGQAILTIDSESQGLSYRPSIDCAMVSAAEQFGQATVGLVLTGMGDDGMVGCQKIKECGGTVLVQDEATSLIYGMPRAVADAGMADAVLSDVQLAMALVQAAESACGANRSFKVLAS